MVFTSSFAILAILFLLFPCRQTNAGAGPDDGSGSSSAALHVLRSGVKTATRSILHWGYIVDPPTLNNVLRYIGFSFGLKWLLVGVALVCVPGFTAGSSSLSAPCSSLRSASSEACKLS